MTQGVPRGRLACHTPDAGHFESDLVPQGGESAWGEEGSPLQLIEGATGWRERVRLLGPGQLARQRACTHVLERLPKAVKEWHPENGTQFFHSPLGREWKERVSAVTLSRRRRYQKNDNRHGAQKNDTLLRHSFGQFRLETAEQIAAGTALDERMWLDSNLFQPVLPRARKNRRGRHRAASMG